MISETDDRDETNRRRHHSKFKQIFHYSEPIPALTRRGKQRVRRPYYAFFQDLHVSQSKILTTPERLYFVADKAHRILFALLYGRRLSLRHYGSSYSKDEIVKLLADVVTYAYDYDILPYVSIEVGRLILSLDGIRDRVLSNTRIYLVPGYFV